MSRGLGDVYKRQRLFLLLILSPLPMFPKNLGSPPTKETLLDFVHKSPWIPEGKLKSKENDTLMTPASSVVAANGIYSTDDPLLSAPTGSGKVPAPVPGGKTPNKAGGAQAK